MKIFSTLTELLLLLGRGQTAFLGTKVDKGAIVSAWIIDEWLRSVGGKINDRRYLKYSENALSYSHFVHHKFRVDWTEPFVWMGYRTTEISNIRRHIQKQIGQEIESWVTGPRFPFAIWKTFILKSIYWYRINVHVTFPTGNNHSIKNWR